eukprot:6454852-Amphidinium_carterae.1
MPVCNNSFSQPQCTNPIKSCVVKDLAVALARGRSKQGTILDAFRMDTMLSDTGQNEQPTMCHRTAYVYIYNYSYNWPPPAQPCSYKLRRCFDVSLTPCGAHWAAFCGQQTANNRTPHSRAQVRASAPPRGLQPIDLIETLNGSAAFDVLKDVRRFGRKTSMRRRQ